MVKRAVLYARVSGDDRSKEGRNLAGQLEMCRKYALKCGYVVVAELAEDDRGASGASFDLEKLNQAREMAQAGEYDVLVVREIDRLSRSLAKQLIVEQELKRSGVAIEYVLGEYADTPEGNFQKNVKAVIAEYEREKIRERTVRARRQKAKAGHIMAHGCAPYGYNLAEVDGKQMLVIDEEEAQVVRLIFTWYTVGDGETGPMSIYRIIKRLTAQRVPTKRDKKPHAVKRGGRGKWYRATVARMLHNETYAGVWHYGKRNGTNPDDYLIPVEVPAIVSRQVWQAAQERLKWNKANSPRNVKHNYLLRRRVVCGACGIKMTVQRTFLRSGNGVHYYYYCPARRQPAYVRKCPRRSSFRADHTDEAVWRWIEAMLADPEMLARGLRKKQSQLEEASRPLRERLVVIDDLLSSNQSQLDRALDLYLSGEFDREMLAERRVQLENTIDALESERDILIERLETRAMNNDQIQTITDYAEKVAKGLEKAHSSFKVRRRIVELLDIEATLTVEEDEKVAYVRCVIGEERLAIVSPSS